MSNESPTIGDVVELVQSIAENSGSPLTVEADTTLLSSGLIDSLAIVELQGALEASFGITLPLEELGFDNADTPEQLLTLVKSRQ
jgi:acyl carrier protein